MPRLDVQIPAPDGRSHGTLHIPGGDGPWPGVLMSRVAAGGPGRTIPAAAPFHGGRVAVADAPSSPYLAADRITAAVYVAGAIGDGSFTTEQAGMLDRALTGAGVEHTVEFYPAHHGFAVPDNPTYNTEAAARQWEALGRLYRDHLGG